MSENRYCPMCNRLAIKLVPLYENKPDFIKCCHRCKKDTKKGIPIKKYLRDETGMVIKIAEVDKHESETIRKI